MQPGAPTPSTQALQPAAAAAALHAVALEDLRTVLVAHKLRRYAGAHMAALAATTAAPLLEVDCAGSLRSLQALRASAIGIGQWKSRVRPLERGHIARLFNRVQAVGGRREVLRTWATGIAHLRREPRYTLHLPLRRPPQPKSPATCR